MADEKLPTSDRESAPPAAARPGARPDALEELPSTGLLSFYDRLRRRVKNTLEGRGGGLGERAADALLLVPDVFVLLLRLALDRDVPSSSRALLGGAIAYFVLPADLLPEALLGGAGYVEDLVLAAAVLAHAFGPQLEPYAARYWSGPRELREVLQDLLRSAEALLGQDLYRRLERLLARRGVPLDEMEYVEEEPSPP